LQHIPVLDDLPLIVHSEDIYPRPISVIRPVLIAVEDNEGALREHAAKFDALARILARHALEVLDEGIFPIGDDRIVLCIPCAT
jgi:hypothetical protein